MATVLEIRKALVARGHTPIPVYGKEPPNSKVTKRKPMMRWQDTKNVTPKMLEMWANVWPDANNTGILTKNTPTLDADILNEPAAIAIEDLVRERFEERGHILPRIGTPPQARDSFSYR